MKLLKLEIGEQFRSLHAGFSINFHRLTDKELNEMHKFQPFCFAGLNGSGKSNVLEALAAIFYHLEFCVAKFRPDSFEKYFCREKCTPDVFVLQYLTCGHNKKHYVPALSDRVTITKEKGKEPIMTIQPFPFTKEEKITQINLVPQKNESRASGKEYLPDVVVGYSSGENEILSLPFIKSRLVQFDEYKEAVVKNYFYDEPESSLIYIDSEMSQAVLLSILLLENEKTLKPLEKELHIKGLRSFRMNLNLHLLYHDKEKKISSPILQQLESQIQKLKACATSWYVDDKVLWLDFFVNENTKLTFHNHFSNSFTLFRLFQILYELNNRVVSDFIKEDVYSSKGVYTDGKLPTGSPTQNVFFFLDYLITKEIESESEPIDLLLRNFSDGEHLFLHTMGICLMLKDRSSLLLLDEPETHFNPSWRTKFIKILDDSIQAGGGNNMMKEVLITSHSPFIISDCLPNNVICFDRDNKNKLLTAFKAAELGLNSYGSDVNYILKNFFKTNMVSDKSFQEMKDVIESGSIDELRKAVDYFGESSEKQFLFKKIYEKMEKKDDNN